MHSMLVATMMVVARIMEGMESNCHHGEKLGISEMEFQFKVGKWVRELKEKLSKNLQNKKEQAILNTLPDESKYLNNLLKPISY